MIRVKMVTRSFPTTKIKAFVFDNETNETREEKFIIAGEYRTDNIALKALRKMTSDSDKLQVLKIISREIDSTLYNIKETEFVRTKRTIQHLAWY